MYKIKSGSTELIVAANDVEAGRLAAEAVIESGLGAVRRGLKPAFWLMAAPSAFAFYEAFVEMARTDSRIVSMIREADWFQFDDYPIGRKNPRFPVTFRHLLETRFYRPLEHNMGNIGNIHSLELTGNEAEDIKVMNNYAEGLNAVLDDPERYVIQVKGNGMDGHWGFHGPETALDAEPGLTTVAVNSANRRQQMIDWPEYFPEEENVPGYAVTCNVALFLKADHIIDIVPQAQKEYAVLACYGHDEVIASIPSSALKNHNKASSFLTEASAKALMEYRKSLESDSRAVLSTAAVERLRSYWKDDKNPDDARANTQKMEDVLRQLKMI